jgi:hypothetical protein
MLHNKQIPSIIRSCCLTKQVRLCRANRHHAQSLDLKYSSLPRPEAQSTSDIKAEPESNKVAADVDARKGGRMSARLSEMTEENLGHGGRSAEKAIEEAGFSEDLKRQLEEKIKDSAFRSENPTAFAQLNMPVGLGLRPPFRMRSNVDTGQRRSRNPQYCSIVAMGR